MLSMTPNTRQPITSCEQRDSSDVDHGVAHSDPSEQRDHGDGAAGDADQGDADTPEQHSSCERQRQQADLPASPAAATHTNMPPPPNAASR
jgi:hypothetical protein